MSVSIPKISQHSAILLERARRCGLSAEELLQGVREQSLQVFAPAQHEHYRYEEWISYAEEHGEDLQKAIQEGYRITFNTRNGLKIWLEQTFGLNSETDFTVGEGMIEGLTLSESQLKLLEQRLAVNWMIADVKHEGTAVIVRLMLRGLQSS
ncbi:hypothetical protein ACH6EH_13575 [Paenibacillus sp. JSM ZJ436]|uniref:hypothetical protein n=1 Tax=Paenibacillus sp. JSM ZJ436 TaxID=3376190 RepID=UPI0037B9BABA